MESRARQEISQQRLEKMKGAGESEDGETEGVRKEGAAEVVTEAGATPPAEGGLVEGAGAGEGGQDAVEPPDIEVDSSGAAQGKFDGGPTADPGQLLDLIA